jgi:hypothetical protein
MSKADGIAIVNGENEQPYREKQIEIASFALPSSAAAEYLPLIAGQKRFYRICAASRRTRP